MYPGVFPEPGKIALLFKELITKHDGRDLTS